MITDKALGRVFWMFVGAGITLALLAAAGVLQ